MRLISYVLLPVLVLGALIPAGPFTSAVAAVTGAAFTTVDPAVDGAGHCANGNPATNCNLYDGARFVWLNGGPAANRLGPDGRFFFAVLSPGGQPSANDGEAKNLSSPFDAYTNRTFAVTNGKVSAYAGTHSFDSGAHSLGAADGKPPFIRLFPYATTLNPGGVYILAICSLAHGYPVSAQDCKFDQFKVQVASPATATPTDTPTSTPTGTATNTPTDTPTSTPTGTATNTPTDTPTSTPTSTPTATATPTNACIVRSEAANYSSIVLGGTVAGLGMVAPDLNIAGAGGSPVKIISGSDPWAYTGDSSGTPTAANPTGARIKNGGLSSGGGFSIIPDSTNRQPQNYTFTFSPGVSISDFTLHMVDFGDWNPTASPTHLVQVIGFDASNAVVVQQTLSYTTPAVTLPTSSNLFGNMQLSGDAMTALSQQPGNWTWHISGHGIVKVTFVSGAGFDSAMGFDQLEFTTECP